MRSDEVRAAGELGAQGFGGVARRAEELHEAIANRSFGPTGAASAPVRATHDAISRVVYATVRGAGASAVRAGSAALAGARPADAPSLGETERGAFALGALNGVKGDELAAAGSPLAVPMGLRVGGRLVPPEPDALAAAFPEAAGHLVLFVHGLCETEAAWRIGTRKHGEGYADLLRAELGVTPLELRYNTGLPIAANGGELAQLLARVVAAWPVRVERLSLVGHSMGGLVLRSAARQAEADGLAWAHLVTQLICLGSPHGGAPLAKGAFAAGRAMRWVPEARPFAGIFDGHSAGIRDLEKGTPGPPPLPWARHAVVTASVTADVNHVVGRLVGDGLVRGASARGEGAVVADLGGLHHLDLLHHPRVYEQLRAWLADDEPGRDAVAVLELPPGSAA